MNAANCPREDELLLGLGRGFITAELAEHVTACASCQELESVAGALLDERSRAIAEAAVPSSGTMWWRMRVRQQLEAESRARQALLFGQAATLVVAVTLLVAFFGADIAAGVRNISGIVQLSTPILLGLLTWLFIAPIASWVALRQK